jgi:hypothetical protein
MVVHNEVKDLNKRLKEIENDIRELRSEDSKIMRKMAIESCETVYNSLLYLQKSAEEINEYGKLWGGKLLDITDEINKSKTIEDISKIRDSFVKDINDYVKALKVDTADKAMEIAHSFIKKYSPVALPLKAERQDDVWMIDIDVGALAVKIAKVKVNARTGDILSYEIPERE